MIIREFLESQTRLRTSADRPQKEQGIVKNIVYNHFHESKSYATSETSTFKSGRESLADVASIADSIVARGVALEMHFDRDPSLVVGIIFITHEEKGRFVPVRAKYDTGSDANFIPSALVERARLSAILVPLEDDSVNVFVGLNNQEYHPTHMVTLDWCASTMHKTQATKFHVIDDVPYDILLGNPFVIENNVFTPPRVALPLRHKNRTAGKLSPSI